MRFEGLGLPKRDTRQSKETALSNPRFIAVVMALWDQGYDTHQIAITMFEHEYAVAFALRIGLERRRGQVPCFASVEAVSRAMRA